MTITYYPFENLVQELKEPSKNDALGKFHTLPNEVITSIFEHLKENDWLTASSSLINAGLVCRSFSILSVDVMKTLPREYHVQASSIAELNERKPQVKALFRKKPYISSVSITHQPLAILCTDLVRPLLHKIGKTDKYEFAEDHNERLVFRLAILTSQTQAKIYILKAGNADRILKAQNADRMLYQAGSLVKIRNIVSYVFYLVKSYFFSSNS